MLKQFLFNAVDDDDEDDDEDDEEEADDDEDDDYLERIFDEILGGKCEWIVWVSNFSNSEL